MRANNTHPRQVYTILLALIFVSVLYIMCMNSLIGSKVSSLFIGLSQKKLNYIFSKLSCQSGSSFAFNQHSQHTSKPDIKLPNEANLNRRENVSMVLGVPTVHRINDSYLLDTLDALFESSTPEEQADCLIVVLVAESDPKYVTSVVRQVERQFNGQLISGILEVSS